MNSTEQTQTSARIFEPDLLVPLFAEWLETTWLERAVDLARARREARDTSKLVAELNELEPLFLAVHDSETGYVPPRKKKTICYPHFDDEGLYASGVDFDFEDDTTREYWEKFLDAERQHRRRWEAGRYTDSDLFQIGSAANRAALRSARRVFSLAGA